MKNLNNGIPEPIANLEMPINANRAATCSVKEYNIRNLNLEVSDYICVLNMFLLLLLSSYVLS